MWLGIFQLQVLEVEFGGFSYAFCATLRSQFLLCWASHVSLHVN